MGTSNTTELWVIPQTYSPYSHHQLRPWQLDPAKHQGDLLIFFLHTLHPMCQEILLIFQYVSRTPQHGHSFPSSKQPSSLAPIIARASQPVSLLLSLLPPVYCPLSSQNSSLNTGVSLHPLFAKDPQQFLMFVKPKVVIVVHETHTVLIAPLLPAIPASSLLIKHTSYSHLQPSHPDPSA